MLDQRRKGRIEVGGDVSCLWIRAARLLVLGSIIPVFFFSPPLSPGAVT